MESAAAIEDGPRSDARAATMFALALAHLALLACMIPHGGVADRISDRLLFDPFVLTLFFGLWAAIAAEGVLGFLQASDRPSPAWRRLALVLAIPAFRMVIAPGRPNSHVWLPRLGWIRTGRAAVEEMELRTALPMLVVTALIVPVIVADFVIGTDPHVAMERKLDEVSRFDISDGGRRLWLMESGERPVDSLRRASAPDARNPGIVGNWSVAGTTATEIRLTGDTFAMRTGCAATKGTMERSGTSLHFTELTRTATCPPSLTDIAIYAVTALIWFSFALEFILMVSLAEKKLDFCKRNWINIVIILLPLLAFLRSLQLFRFLRMAKAGKLMKAYRLRGLITRIVKLALVFNLIERILARNPERYCEHLEEKLAEKREEMDRLEQKLAEARREAAGTA